jgi:glyoxylase-like metal-dependent hydrolase (beta-lactamase superfamily II)
MDILPLTLRYDINGQVTELHPSLIRSEDKIWLVDCGYEGSLPMIKTAVSQHGVDISELEGIIMSHDDIDHLGGLKEIKDAYPSIKVLSSEIEAPYISGSLRSLRIQQAEELFPYLPEEHKEWALSFQEQLRSIKRVPVDQTFSFDAEISEGIQIVNTPGHTPGHISIYLPDLKTLIASDAIVFENGQLDIANPGFCLDLPAALESVRKIAGLHIASIYCYHGGPVFEGVAEKLEDLLGRYGG